VLITGPSAGHSNIYGQHNRKRKPMPPPQSDDVNLDFRIVTFRRSKSGKGYKVPINDTALNAFKVLRERCDGTGAVVRKPSGIELKSSRRWFENCLAEAKATGFRWHDLRHTAASRLRADEYVKLEDISYLMGHGSQNITLRYAHPNMAALLKVVKKLDRTETQTVTNTVHADVLEFSAQKATA
jgi:integrase